MLKESTSNQLAKLLQDQTKADKMRSVSTFMKEVQELADWLILNDTENKTGLELAKQAMIVKLAVKESINEQI
jgi:hypothetical protein